jgi:hypothetical protein
MKRGITAFFTALLICPVQAATSTDHALAGHWAWKSKTILDGVPEGSFSLDLATQGKLVHGIYCDISAGGRHIDCAESGDNITGRISSTGKEASLTMLDRDRHPTQATIRLVSRDSMELRKIRTASGWPDDTTILIRVGTVPKDRGACVITSSVNKAYFHDAPRASNQSKSYILRDETVLARGWSSSQKFLLVTYDPEKGRRRTEWVECSDFDACPAGKPYYRGMPEAMCVGSLPIVE